MQITFTKDEIKDILLREAEVMVSNYHMGEAKYDLSTIYLNDVRIDVELLPYEETIEMDESDLIDDLIDVIDQPEEVESLDELEKELKAFNPDPDGTEDYFEEARAKLNA